MNALETFLNDPTPRNAVLLAIEDHKAQKIIDWAFVTALNRAADILEAL